MSDNTAALLDSPELRQAIVIALRKKMDEEFETYLLNAMTLPLLPPLKEDPMTPRIGIINIRCA